MFIRGIGIICGAGIGINSFKEADLRTIPTTIDNNIIKSYRLPRQMRRADRFAKLAAIAAGDALSDAQLTEQDKLTNCGVLLASAFGPHQTTFAFLDDLLDYPENEISPTKFSHSVHNAAASYIAMLYGLKAISVTVTGFNNIWFNALGMAENLLNQDSISQILLLGVDENALINHLLRENRPQLLNGVEQFMECAVGMVLSSEPCYNCAEITTHEEKSTSAEQKIIIRQDMITLTNGKSIQLSLPSRVPFGSALETISTIIS